MRGTLGVLVWLTVMMLARPSQPRPVEFYMLLEPRPDGPALGTYAGRPIPMAVIDADGRRYVYAGTAPRLMNGRFDLEALGKDEWLVEPGLVYRGDKGAGGC